MKPKVLMVEDDANAAELACAVLGDTVDLIHAPTLALGLALFQEHKDSLALILMDACVPGDSPNAMPLVQKMRASGFTKPIIATSSRPKYRQLLMQAGASDECNKPSIPAKVRAVLQLS